MNQNLQIESVIEAAHTIPCAPAILPKVLAMISGTDVHSRDLEHVVMADPGLATGVLRLANSAYFARARRCDNLTEAILRLGTVNLFRLIASAAASRWLTHPVQGYGWEAGDLSVHSLCVAVAAEHFARKLTMEEPSIAYTGGLIHDVGKLALAYANVDALEAVASLVPQKQCSWREGEREVLGYDSANVSERLLRSWGFPDPLVAVASHYHRPSEAPEEHRRIVTLVHAAKHVALGIGLGVGADGFRTELDEPALAEQGFTAETIESSVPEIVEEIERLSPPGESLNWR